VVEMYKFIKKHASIPFKLKRQDSMARTESAQTEGTNLKDEL
jgi:protein disulfide-isomerase A1